MEMDIFDYEQFLENEIGKLDDDNLDQSISLENINLNASEIDLFEENLEIDDWEKFTSYDRELNIVNEIGGDNYTRSYPGYQYHSRLPHEPEVINLMDEILDAVIAVSKLVSNEVYLPTETNWSSQLRTVSISHDEDLTCSNFSVNQIGSYKSSTLYYDDFNTNENSQPLIIAMEGIDNYFEPVSINSEVLDENLHVNNFVGSILSSEILATDSVNVDINDFTNDIIKLQKESRLNRKVKRTDFSSKHKQLNAAIKLQSKFRCHLHKKHYAQLKFEKCRLENYIREDLHRQNIENNIMFSLDIESRANELRMRRMHIKLQERKRECIETELFYNEEYFGFINRELDELKELFHNVRIEPSGCSSSSDDGDSTCNDCTEITYSCKLPPILSLLDSWKILLVSTSKVNQKKLIPNSVQQMQSSTVRSLWEANHDPSVKSLISWLEFRAQQNYKSQTSSLENQSHPNREIEPPPPPAPALHSIQLTIKDIEILDSLGIDPRNVNGFQSLSLNVEELNTVTFLSHFRKLAKLELNVNRLSSLSGLECLADLRELSVKDNLLNSVYDLRSLCKLESIKLDTNRLSNIDGLPVHSLRHLSANHNLLKEFPLFNCESLYHLELNHNRISSIDSLHVCNLPNLLHLDLSGNLISDIDGNSISKCQLLQTLVLSHNTLNGLPAPLFLPNLQKLWLSGNKITQLSNWLPSDMMLNFLELKYENSQVFSSTRWPVFLPKLSALYLQDNLIANVTVGSLSSLLSLKTIDLSFNKLKTKTDLLGLVVIPNSIENIILHDNPIYEMSKTEDDSNGFTNAAAKSMGVTNKLVNFLRLSCEKLSRVSNYVFEGEGDYFDHLYNCHLYNESVDEFRQHFHNLMSKRFEQTSVLDLSRKHHRPPSSSSLRQLNNLLLAHHEITNSVLLNDPSKNRDNVNSNCFALLKMFQNVSIDADRLLQFTLDPSFDEKSNFKRYRNGQISSSFAYKQRQQILSLANVSKDVDEYSCLDKLQTDHILCCQRINYFVQFAKDNLFLDNPDKLDSNSGLQYILIDTTEILQKFQRNRYEEKQKENLEFENKKIHASVQIQCLYRGFRVRKNILEDVQLVDKDEFYEHSTEMSGILSQSVNDEAHLVYGDHRRANRKLSQQSAEIVLKEEHDKSINNLKPSSVHDALESVDDSDVIISNTRTHTQRGGLSRPDTSQTDTSELTDNSDFIQNILTRHSNSYSGITAITSSSTNKIASKSTDRMVEEWRINDPKLAATLMKRNKKLKQLQNAKINREKDKDPEFRLQKFMKSTFLNSNANAYDNQSTEKMLNNNEASTIKTKKSRNLLPAWLMGEKNSEN